MNKILFAVAATTLSLLGADFDYAANDKPL